MTSVPTGIGRGPDQAESFLERLPLAVLVLDAELRAVEVSGGWAQLCGRSQHDSRGSLWWQRIDPRDRAALRHALSSPGPSEDVRAEHRVAGADGPRWTRWWWRPDGDRTWVCVADVDADWSRTSASRSVAGRPAPSPADVGGEQLASVLVPMLFRLGLSLHAVVDGADELTASRLRDVIDELDDAIASLRRSALAKLRAAADDASVRVAFGQLESAIVAAEHALAREWAKAAASASDDAGLALRLVRSSRLLRAGGRALEPDVLG